LGSFRDGRHLGTIGELGCLSFSSPKVITTGQGGAVLTDDDDLAAAMRRRKNFGRAADGREIHDMAGFNFKFTDLQAVVGLEQMKKLAGRLRRKKEIWARYAAGLAGVADVTLLATDLDQVAPWFIDIYVDNRDELGDGLKDAGIGTRTVYPPIHAQRAYGRRDNSYPVAAAASARGLWLPSSFQLTDDQVDRVCGAIRAFYGA
jgi:perosamine synthetase